MLDQRSQERFAQSCTDAAVGYMTAGGAAWLEATRRSFELWSSAVSAWTPKPEPRSWYRHPDEPNRSAASVPALANPFAALPFAQTSPFAAPAEWQRMLAPWMAPFMRPETPFPLAVLAPWWETAMSQRAMQAWPMAFFMISIGIPEGVARPAAQANAAVLDASQVARGAVDRAFAAYRSEGGHASAHVIGGEKLVMAMLLPFTALPFLR